MVVRTTAVMSRALAPYGGSSDSECARTASATDDNRCSRVSDSITHAAPLLGIPLRVLASLGAVFRDCKGLTLPPPASDGPMSEPSPPPLPVGLLGFGATAPTELKLAMSGQSRRL